MSEDGSRRRLYALLALMTLVWSINFVVAKNALNEFSPLMLGALRYTVGALIILPVYLWKKRTLPRLEIGPAWKVIAVGVLGVGINQLLFLIGLVRTSVAHAAILIAMQPVLILILSRLVGHEQLTRGKLAGLALALSGVAVLQGRTLMGGQGSILGDFFVFLAAISFAIYTVAGKQIRGRYDGLTMTTMAFVGSAAVLSPVTLWLAANSDFTRVSWVGWTSVVYIATFPSVIAYLIYYHALRFMPSTKVSRLTYLQPFIATAVAVPVLGEKITPSLVTGGALVLAGVFVTERQ